MKSINSRTKKKKKQQSNEKSLLTRFFKSGKKKKGGAKEILNGGTPGSGKSAEKMKPLSSMDRSIQEIKQLMKVGQDDPERLALLLSNLLGTEREKMQQKQAAFDQMVWDIVAKKEEKESVSSSKNNVNKDDELSKDSTPTSGKAKLVEKVTLKPKSAQRKISAPAKIVPITNQDPNLINNGLLYIQKKY